MPNINGRKSLSKQQRFQILFRDNFTCQKCGANKKEDPRVKLEIDHRNAFALGGEETVDNLWTLCFACNRGKGIKTNFNPKDGKTLSEVVAQEKKEERGGKKEPSKDISTIMEEQNLPILPALEVLSPEERAETHGKKQSVRVLGKTSFYAPLSSDPYKAWVRFYVSTVQKDTDDGVPDFFGISEDNLRWFQREYSISEDELMDFMSKDSWDMDLVTENRIKLNLQKIKVSDSLTKAAAYGNAPAVAFLQKETETRTPQTSNTFIIENAVIQNMLEAKGRIRGV